MQKLIRITTVPGSLRSLLRGQLRFMNKYYDVIGISTQTESLDEVERNEGVKTYGVEMTRTITPVKDLIATYKLYKIFKKERPFIVHTHTPKAGTVGMLAAKLAGVPHRLHTIAGLPLLETSGVKRKLLDSVERFTYSCATKILPNSFGLEEIILKNEYTRPQNLKVIGHGSSNGIDTSHYDSTLIKETDKECIRKEIGVKNTDFVFIFIGRIVKDKGINELVNAFDKLSEKNKQCKLIFVGGRDGNLNPLSSSTETMIRENCNILSVGWQKDIRPYIAISNVLAFPSYREGFPNVVLQASSMGLPSIVTDINGCNEIIEHKVNGLIIPPKNDSALLKAMQFMLDNPEIVNAMKTHTRSRIIERYEQDYIWNEILKFYKSLE